MSYRIQVRPAALRLLRNFSDHVLQRAGRMLAELAELAGTSQQPRLALARVRSHRQHRLDLDDASLFYEIDPRTRTLVVTRAVPK